ncbi:MAG TPA: acyloxyacyl hydrolase [Caulobacteraceae bacterium]
MQRSLIAPFVLAAALVGAPVGSARAQEVFAGAYVHDARLGITVCCYEHGADFELGARTAPLGFLHRLGDFHFYGLGSVNTAGGVDFAAAGILVRLHLGRRFYIAPGIGGAVQNGDADQFQRRPDHLDLGSRVLFEPELSLGYTLSRRWAAELSYVHLSHAQLAGPQNPGMDDVGARLVYRFGE